MLLLFSSVKAEEPNTFYWRGRIIDGDTGEPVPNAVVALYRTMIMYSSDIDGIVRLRLQKNDSVRVVVLGFAGETFRINELQADSTGHSIMKIYRVSYQLKEVTVKGYRGLLNPMIFPNFDDGKPKLQTNFHYENIGTKMSGLPPNEQFFPENPPILAALISPATYLYARFSKEQKSLRKLQEAKYHANIEERLKDYISPEALAVISGYEGDELEKFIVYCNANLRLYQNDTGASVTAKIMSILEKFKAEN